MHQLPREGDSRQRQDAVRQPGEAVQWFERAYTQKDPGLYALKVDLRIKNLDRDPRYLAFLRKMNLPE